MRLELALIVGIVFFCCWCAYIIIKMNSSVPNLSNVSQYYNDIPSTTTIRPSTFAPTDQLDPNYIYKSRQVHLPQQQYPNHYQHQPTEGRPQFVAPYATQMQQAHIWSTTRRPLGSYLHDPQSTWRAPLIQYQGSGSPHMLGGESNNLALPSDQQHYAKIQAASSEQDPDEQQVDDQDNGEQELGDINEDAAEPDIDRDQQPQIDESDYQEQPVNSELEDRVGGRSFDEDESSSNERDRNGIIVKEKHRHFVNGKPVRARRDKKDGLLNHDNEADAINFDQLVNEIDGTENERDDSQANEQEYERRTDDVDQANSNEHKTRLDAIKTNLMHNQIDKPKDMHQHQLHESLTAQQWDDNVNGTTGDDVNGTQKVDNDGQFSSVDVDRAVEEQEAAAATTPSPVAVADFDDLDLLGSSGSGRWLSLDRKLSHSGGLRLSRTRRSVMFTDKRAASNSELSQSPDQVGYHDSSLGLNSEVKNFTGSTGGSDGVKHSDDLTTSQRDDIGPIRSSHDATRGDGLNADADMSIEVLAGPPSVRQPDAYTVSAQPQGSPTGLLTSNLILPEVASHNQQLVPVESPRIASGSRLNSKRKKKMKKSKMSESKYKAAKALASKKKSKYKKGFIRAKEAKMKKKQGLNQKEFKKATKGGKSAKGLAHRGGKKGSIYLKDKGYKKKGFKKSYQKVEAGDHKTYFDEFRDKDHSKKWKHFKDGHKYSQNKHWLGKDKKMHKHHKSDMMKHKKSKAGDWKEQKKSKYSKDFKHISKKSKKSSKKGKKQS